MSDRDDAHLLSGAYALDALTPEEAAEIEAAMHGSEELRGEVTGLVDTAVALGLAVPPVAPPPALRGRLLAAIESTPQEPAEAPLPAAQQHETARHVAPRRRRRLRPAAVLAVLGAAVLLFAGGFLVQRAVLQPQSEYTRISAAADVQRESARLRGGGTATVEWSAREGGTAVVLNGVTAPEGKVLQLWSLRGDRITSDGLYRPENGANYTVLDGVPAAGERFAVSIEPVGGSDQPTTTPLVILPLRL